MFALDAEEYRNRSTSSEGCVSTKDILDSIGRNLKFGELVIILQSSMENDQEHRDSNNVLLFRLAITNNLKRIAESVSENDFLDILTMLKSKPKIARKLHKAMFEELFENMNADLNDIFNDGSMQEGMEKVAKLSDADSSITEDAWRPPGNVSLHLRALDALTIKEECDLLEKRVNEMEEENANLMKKIADERSRVTVINDNITECLGKSSIAIDTLGKRLEGLEECFLMLDHE